MSIDPSSPLPASASSGATTANKINPLLETGKGKGEDHFSFWDVLDVINPLQHIPIVSNIYRAVTGDQINNAARVAGDALYGGVIGAAFGVANAVAVHTAGDDLGGVAMSKLGLLKSQEEARKDPDNGIPNPSAPPVPANIPVVEIHPSDKNGPKDEIIWDQPQKTAETQPAAMPTAKQLNDLEPTSGTTDPSVNKADVQNKMADALNKYQTMQNASPLSTGMIKPVDNGAAQAAPKNIFAVPAGAPVNVADNTVPAAAQPSAAFNKLRHFTSR